MHIHLTYCRELWDHVAMVWPAYGSNLANRRPGLPMKEQYYN